VVEVLGMRIDLQKLVNDKMYCEKAFNRFIKLKMIREDKTRLFGKHLHKALKNLEFANFIFSEHDYSIKEKLGIQTFYDWCITIYYYALYHTALALVTKAGYYSKSHISTITAITLFYFHKDNILNKEDIEFLIDKINLDRKDIDLILDSKELRERACYGTDETFEKMIAEKLQKETADFVTRMREVLE
jgi:uncharacterized protein (UPF0332 family)